MGKKEIKGIIPPIITPMNQDETIHEEELRNQVNRLIKAGIHGIFPCGTNGEGYALEEKEKLRVLEIVVEETKGRIPVYAGTGCITTKETIRQSKLAEKMGADVLSVITPYFAAASQEELYEHYKALAQAVQIPIIMYNIPARTGNVLSPDIVARLSQIDNIAGVKDSSGNFDNLLQYIEKTKKQKDFAVLAGNDSLILWNLMAGGTGGVAGCANVFPEVMVSIYEEFIEHDLDKARKAQDSIRAFRDCFKYGNSNTVIKAAVEFLGYPVGKCRAPFNKLSETGLEAVKTVLKECREKGMC